MITKHKHADILIAIANGETVQFKTTSNPSVPWKNWNPDIKSPLSYNVDNWVWRVKPDTILVNGVEVKRPVLVPVVGKNSKKVVIITMLSQNGFIQDRCLLTESESDADTLFDALIKPFV